jgi:hypothetical protein
MLVNKNHHALSPTACIMDSQSEIIFVLGQGPSRARSRPSLFSNDWSRRADCAGRGRARGLTDRRAHRLRLRTVSCQQRLAIFALGRRSQPVIAIIGLKGL